MSKRALHLYVQATQKMYITGIYIDMDKKNTELRANLEKNRKVKKKNPNNLI